MPSPRSGPRNTCCCGQSRHRPVGVMGLHPGLSEGGHIWREVSKLRRCPYETGWCPCEKGTFRHRCAGALQIHREKMAVRLERHVHEPVAPRSTSPWDARGELGCFFGLQNVPHPTLGGGIEPQSWKRHISAESMCPGWGVLWGSPRELKRLPH